MLCYLVKFFRNLSVVVTHSHCLYIHIHHMPIFWLWSIFVIIKFVPIYLYIYIYIIINNENFFLCVEVVCENTCAYCAFQLCT